MYDVHIPVKTLERESMQKPFPLIAPVLLTAVAVLRCFDAESGEQVVPCPRTVAPLNLDGSLADFVWRGMSPMTGFVKADGGVTDRVWLSTAGSCAMARTAGGKVTEVTAYQVPKVEHDGVSLELAVPVLVGKVKSVDYDGHGFTTDLAPPNPAALCGRTLFVSSPDYNHNTAYRIESCDGNGRFDFGLVGFDLAVADYDRREKDGTVISSTPMTLSWTGGAPRATGMLNGKLARTPNGARWGFVKEIEKYTRFRFKPNCSIEQGDSFVIYDVKAGDKVTIPMAASMTLRKDGSWGLFATCDVIVSIGTGPVSYLDAAGKWIKAKKDGTAFRVPISECADGRTTLRIEQQ